ncbi:hypothetical protein SNF32_13320 [Enterococcus mundtii]|nr:hypothetical protein [Enterococcus mundtii]
MHWRTRYPDYRFCHRAFFRYDHAFRTWLKQYKFMGDILLAHTFSLELQELRKQYKSFVFVRSHCLQKGSAKGDLIK